MEQQLSLSARPRTLDGMIGIDRTIRNIRNRWASGRVTKAWLFVGAKGTGKTTIGKILALSHVCDHQKIFGAPCPECRRNRRDFDIYEINGAKIRGLREVEQALEGAVYAPRTGNFRVYILDECQKLTLDAQNLILRYLEDDSAKTTIFILLTTDPHILLDTVRSRCTTYQLKEFEEEDILKLINRLMLRVGSDREPERLAMALAERQIGSARLIAQAVEKYVTGATVEESCEVEGSTAVDTRGLTRAIVKGSWIDAAKILENFQLSDTDGIRLGTVTYMRKMLLHSPEVGHRTKAIADAITELVSISRFQEEKSLAAALTAALYRATSYFATYKG